MGPPVDRSTLPTDPVRSALMARVRQKGTTPELAVAAALRAAGWSYRKTARDLPGSPDFVNRRRHWAVFVNGCYWHHHRCPRGTTPSRNRAFWLAKFEANRRRDARAVVALRRLGYRVLVIWECETRDPARLARRLLTLSGAPVRRPTANGRVVPVEPQATAPT